MHYNKYILTKIYAGKRGDLCLEKLIGVIAHNQKRFAISLNGTENMSFFFASMLTRQFAVHMPTVSLISALHTLHTTAQQRTSFIDGLMRIFLEIVE